MGGSQAGMGLKVLEANELVRSGHVLIHSGSTSRIGEAIAQARRWAGLPVRIKSKV